LHKFFHRGAPWARTALAALGVASLICLLAASGCVNPEGGQSASSGAAADTAAGATAHNQAPVQNVKGAVPSAGDVLIAGGANASNQSLATAEFFDPSSGEFFATGTASSSRAGASAAVFSPTQVLLAGGFSGEALIKNYSLDLNGSTLSSVEIFDESTGTFSRTGRMATARMGFTATTLNSGKVLVAGGLDNHGNVLDTAQLYDPVAQKFVAIANPMSDHRMLHTATLLASGKVLVAGGLDNHGNVLDTAQLYDPVAQKFVAIANPMSDHRMLHTATLLASGKVLVAGGVTNLSGDTTNSADLYDPASNTFTPTTFPMDHQRAAHTATLFVSGPMAGKVLITGGVGGSSFFFKDSSAELFDPASQEFVLLTTFMNEPRALHTATLLDDGSVLLAGGFSGTVAISSGMLSGASGLTSDSAEVFDPNTGDFSCVGGFNGATLRCNPSMTFARAGHTATLLATGPTPHRVLIAGGIGGADPAAHGKSLSSAELFNPAGGGSFHPTGAMTTARALHTATLLH
jgi:large repetitive protein